MLNDLKCDIPSDALLTVIDPFENIDLNILFLVSDKSPRDAIHTWLYHLSEIRAFKVYLKIAFSNFYPSLNRNGL